MPYVFINELDMKKLPKMEQPYYNNIEEIIEYQILYSLGIENIIIEYNDKITKETKNIISEKLPKINQDIEGNISLPKDLITYLNNVKNKIYNMEEIYEWNIIEDLIEELHIQLNIKHGKPEQKIKKSIGRPKKMKQQEQNQLKIDQMLNKNIIFEEDIIIKE